MADLLGSIGVSLVLLAYFLNLFGRLATDDLRYLAANFVGAGLACASSVLLGSIPFTVLEGTWSAVSLVGLLRRLLGR